jgi:hypothetical protein
VGGKGKITKLLHFTRVPSDSKLPPVYTALVVGKGVAQDCIFLKNEFVIYCLEAGTATPPIVIPTFGRDSVALVIASISMESHDQGACFFNTTYYGVGMLTEE